MSARAGTPQQQAFDLDAIRACFESVIPGTMATAALDGTPNISYLSQVQFVDSEHVALSYQFFNKTRANLLANPRALLAVVDPFTAAHYRLTLEFQRTERSGPLFDSMKAKLSGLASHMGMGGVFQLLGTDVFRVCALECVPGDTLPPPPRRRNLLAALRTSCERVRPKVDLEAILNETLACLDTEFDIQHSMALMHDAAGQRLYTLASRGYAASGVGSEIGIGEGVIGVAARERTPIRISHMSSEYAYNRAIRNSTMDAGFEVALETEIPLPGLGAQSRSQLAVPIMAGARLLGVLYVESPLDLRFGSGDEDALVSLAGQLGLAMQVMQTLPEGGADEESGALDAQRSAAAGPARPAPGAEALLVRHFPENDSVFLGEDYLIKGVAGSIFAMLVRECIDTGRTEYTNRELRLDPRIRLPDVSDNLEGRLLLLSRRLIERQAGITIEKTGRGRFRLCVERPLKLVGGGA